MHGICQGSGAALLISVYSPSSATSDFPLYPSFFFLSKKALPVLLQNILDTDRARRYKARTNNVHKDNIPARIVFRLRMFLITSQTSMSVALKWIFVKSLPTNFYFGNHLWNHDGFLGQRPKPSFFFLSENYFFQHFCK